MPVGWTAVKKTDGSGKYRTFADLFSLQPGHVADVHIRNDPLKNSSSNAYSLQVGGGPDVGYPLLYGEAKDFMRFDPARFCIQDGGNVTYFDVEVSGCAIDCPGCRR